MPDDYIAYLVDASTATIVDALRLPERALDVSVADGRLLWQVGGRRLDVSLVALSEANLGIRSFGSADFLAFSLHFGDPSGGGVALLTSIDGLQWFEEFVTAMRELLPCPVHDRAERN